MRIFFYFLVLFLAFNTSALAQEAGLSEEADLVELPFSHRKVSISVAKKLSHLDYDAQIEELRHAEVFYFEMFDRKTLTQITGDKISENELAAIIYHATNVMKSFPSAQAFTVVPGLKLVENPQIFAKRKIIVGLQARIKTRPFYLVHEWMHLKMGDLPKPMLRNNKIFGPRDIYAMEQIANDKYAKLSPVDPLTGEQVPPAEKDMPQAFELLAEVNYLNLLASLNSTIEELDLHTMLNQHKLGAASLDFSAGSLHLAQTIRNIENELGRASNRAKNLNDISDKSKSYLQGITILKSLCIEQIDVLFSKAQESMTDGEYQAWLKDTDVQFLAVKRR